jgi:hypothetical protein
LRFAAVVCAVGTNYTRYENLRAVRYAAFSGFLFKLNELPTPQWLNLSHRIWRNLAANECCLPPAPNWAWLPRIPLTAVYVLSAAAFIILVCVGKARRASLSPLLISFFVFVSAVSVLSFSYFYEKDKAVLKKCAAYPIPEDGVKAGLFFMEGEPVNIRAESDSWVYVESFRPNVLEKYGWIKKENAAMIAR